MIRYLTLLVAVLTLSACSDSIKPGIAVGDDSPPSHNKIVGPGLDLKDVCSMDIPDKLHDHQIADLRAQHVPFLVVFGTPQHCTMCVDQLVRVATLKEKYGDRFAFLHVDGYRDDAVWVEWGIQGEPWTFVVDKHGVVTAVYPGPTDVVLMEKAILAILDEEEPS